MSPENERHLNADALTQIRRANSRSSFFDRFRREEGGNVAIIFAMTSIVAVSLVGGAVDFGRVYNFQSKLQATLDAAALAATSQLSMDANHDITVAEARATSYFNAIINGENGATLSKATNTSTMTVTLTADATVATPFLSLVGINSVALSAAAVASGTQTMASGDADVELSLMLDITGSMGDPDGTGGTKLAAMQKAAKGLIDVLIPTTGPIHAKIALAPFSSSINVGDYVAAATGQPLVKTTTTSYKCNPQETCAPATCEAYSKKTGACKSWNDPVCETKYDTCTKTSTSYLKRCLTERTGDYNFDDNSPGTGFNYSYSSKESSAVNCSPNQQIQPLTVDRKSLKDRIDTFTDGGATAGQLGTAWAWYMLSPEWAPVFTGASTPRPYGTAKMRKIAVLMTDGEYNTYYASGQGDSTEQARTLCANMKTAGIEIFTVGFMLPNDVAKETMRVCASKPENAFLAENGDQLNSSFQAIAYRVVPIHLKK